ncbi:MAG: carboxypeptidase regulatory-like domain-containing protein [Bacteroidetes bacterium]|nr:carboxypeptidase regulatory-like domain-containing protein [Bacteroidota bacterium]
MKRILTGLALIMASLPALAQIITGTVKDSTGAAIPNASINLKSRLQDIILAYTTTDTGGAYRLRPPAGIAPADLYLEVRCIGYKDQTKPLTILPSIINFSLAISPSELPSIVVHNNRPRLRTSGDTLSYKVSDFTNPQDRVIGDIIKKLPGISVASDGTISYNNKPISRLYISGDNLLDDKYTIATNSIPQDIVDQIQVIDNHQPVKVLQNKVTSNDVALNLTIKNKARLHLLGQESIGAGLPGNYDVTLNAMLFKDRFKALDYIKGNNTGDDLQRELVSHNAASTNQELGNEPPASLLSLGSVNTPALARNRYLFDRSGMIGANNLTTLKNDLQLRLNAWYLHDRQQQDYSQKTTTFLPGDTIQYSETQHNRLVPDLFHTQLTLTLNKEKVYLNDVLLLDDNHQTNYSHLNTNRSQADQTFSDNTLSFSNEWNGMLSTSSKNIIQLYSYISHFSEPETRTIGPNYNPEIFNHGLPYLQLVQNANVPTWFTYNYISYKIPGDLITKSFTTGLSWQQQQLTSTLTPASDSSANNLSWTNQKGFAEAALDMPAPDGPLKAHLSLPLTIQQLSYSDPGYSLSKNMTRVNFDPRLACKYMVGVEDFITLQYNYRNGIGTVEDIYQGTILKDYRTLYANSSDLTLRQLQRATLGYNYRKAIKLLFASINLSYDHTNANNISASKITDNLQQRIVLPYPNTSSSWTINASFSQYSFNAHTTFSSDLQWQNSRSVEFQNGALLPFNTTTITLSGGTETKLNDHLNFSYRVTAAQTRIQATNHIDQLQQLASIYYIPVPVLQLSTSGEYYLTNRSGNPSLKYFFADASAKYHITKRNIDLQLTASNLFNIKTYNALYLTTNTLVANSYTLPGRIILFKVLFNL